MAVSNSTIRAKQSLFRIQVPDWGDTAFDDVADLFKNNDPVQDPSATGNDALSRVAGSLGPNGRSPQLRPTSSGGIDVHNNFAWTGSKASTAREDLPFIYMKEKLVNRSSRLQNLMYNTFALLQTPAAPVIAAGATGFQAQKLAGNLTKNASRGTELIARTGAAIVGAAAGGAAVSYGTDLAEGFLSGENYQNQLAPYKGLYSTTDTGFVYKLPFVKTTGRISKQLGSDWNEDGEGFGTLAKGLGGGLESFGSAGVPFLGQVGNALQFAADIGEMATNAQDSLKYVFAGAHSEKAKTYNYRGGNNFDISFYLFNNVEWAETVKNWQFVYLIQYQNLPNRLNRLILTPPVIYEVNVPGYFYSMYTSIRSIEVDYIGSNFLLNMPIEFLGEGNVGSEEIKKASNGSTPNSTSSREVKVLVPEAYKVNITFENLLPETQNLFYQANT